MSGVLILGAGGHGKVIADIMRCQDRALLGFLDDDPAKWGTTLCGLPVFGSIDSYAEYAATGLVIGVGDIAVRRRIAERLGDAATSLWCNALHPRAIIAASVRMGSGVTVTAGAVVNPDVLLGDHAIVNTGATVDHDCEIGAFAHIAPGVHLAGGVQIGQGTLVGVGATVAPWHCVGAETIVAAGSVVVTDIPGHITVKGIPAREWFRHRDRLAKAYPDVAAAGMVSNGTYGNDA